MTSVRKQELREIKGYIYNHESFGTVDGPGIRYVFFLQGCPLRCLYCHNPDSIPFNTGEVWTAGQVVDEIVRYKGYIKNGGATLSGGEPLGQPEFSAAVMELLKELGIHTALDTSGCFEPTHPLIKKVIDAADLIILDIKSVDKKISEKLSGKDSDNAFKTLDYCELINKPVWIRQVLLEGYTIDDEQMTRLALSLKDYTCIERIEFLPFHKLGEPKWDHIGREYKLYDTPATTREQVEHIREIFLKNGLYAAK